MKTKLVNLGYCIGRVSKSSLGRIRVEIMQPSHADQVYEPACSTVFVIGADEANDFVAAITDGLKESENI